MLDLTCLLTTGRASDSLSDYLGSGEQMSERVRLLPHCILAIVLKFVFNRAFKSGNQR